MKKHVAGDELLKNAKKIHMVGIGGSGMCPLAEILHSKGYSLTGSDVNESDPLKRIRALGIEVHMGHKAETSTEPILLSIRLPYLMTILSFWRLKGCLSLLWSVQNCLAR